MMRYVLLDALFLAVAVSVAAWRRTRLRGSGSRRVKLAILLLLLTVVFDNFILLLHIVGYRPSHILGVFIGKAPIEDLGYTLAAVLLIPALWGNDR